MLIGFSSLASLASSTKHRAPDKLILALFACSIDRQHPPPKLGNHWVYIETEIQRTSAIKPKYVMYRQSGVFETRLVDLTAETGFFSKHDSVFSSPGTHNYAIKLQGVMVHLYRKASKQVESSRPHFSSLKVETAPWRTYRHQWRRFPPRRRLACILFLNSS
jgi:hypothetical protein